MSILKCLNGFYLAMFKLEKGCIQIESIFKLGDDQSPVQLDPHSEVGAFKVVGHCAWAKPEDKITPDFLRSRVEPWLTALFSLNT